MRTSALRVTGLCSTVGRGWSRSLQVELVGVAGHIEDLEVGAPRPQRSGQCRSAHVRHHDVGDEEIDVAAASVELLERVAAIGGLHHGMTGLTEETGEEGADIGVVFDQQHRTRGLGRLGGQGRGPAAACLDGALALDRG